MEVEKLSEEVAISDRLCGVEGEKLSEEGATSDRFWVGKWKSRHKKGELQTGLGVRGEKLSQVRLTSGGELTLQLISRYMDLLAYS